MLAKRVYRMMLRVYSPQFRRESEAAMLEAFGDAHAAARSRGPLAVAWAWVVTVADIAVSAVPDRLGQLRGRPQIPRSPARGHRPSLWETTTQDIRFAARVLMKSPGFTAVAVTTAALGIGATTTIFSVANSLLLRTPPGVLNPRELVTVHTTSGNGSSLHAFSHLNFADYRDGESGLSGFAAYSIFMAGLNSGGEPELLLGLQVSHNYFDVLGTRPALGRFFAPEEDQTLDTHPVVVLSHRIWQRRYAADSSVVGQTVTLNRHSFTVIGIAEEGFQGHIGMADMSVWIPLKARQLVEAPDGRFTNRDSSWLETIGRRRPGVSRPQVQQAMTLIARSLETTYPDVNEGEGIDVRAYSPVLGAVTPIAGFMALLFIVSVLILLIACVNVANMLLSRAAARGKEVAIRCALGAGRGRLLRQLLTESVMLYVLGGAAGTLLAFLTTQLFATIRLPISVPIVLDFAPDGRVLAFTLLMTLVAGVLFGLAPALQMTRPNLNDVMKAESNGDGGRRSRLRGVFVIAQVAGSTLLLVGAGLFLRALSQADSIDVGFDPDNVHVLGLNLAMHNYNDAEAAAFFDDLQLRVASIPGVQRVGLTDLPPLSFGNQTSVFVVPGRDPVPNEGFQQTDIARVTAGYFETMRIPLVRGRNFGPTDRDGAPRVVIVNEHIARRVWPDENPVGKTIEFGRFENGTPMEIVGVAAQAKYRSLGEPDRPMLYLPYYQQRRSKMTLVARADGERPGLQRTIRNTALTLDPDLPVSANAPFREIMGLALLPNRIAAALATAFGLLGMVLASVGLYGVLAYSVSQRSREIGIRVALGASGPDVRRLILSDGFRLTGIGLGIGVGAAVILTRLMRGLLYGVSPTDPATFGTIALLLTTVAFIACYLPARRAANADPTRALRSQ